VAVSLVFAGAVAAAAPPPPLTGFSLDPRQPIYQLDALKYLDKDQWCQPSPLTVLKNGPRLRNASSVPLQEVSSVENHRVSI
jgi:hypothetical protein